MIAILDYGSGNLRSAERAFATSGLDVVVTADRAVALEADGLVVPGVGAFAACMKGLQSVDGASIPNYSGTYKFFNFTCTYAYMHIMYIFS